MINAASLNSSETFFCLGSSSENTPLNIQALNLWIVDSTVNPFKNEDGNTYAMKKLHHAGMV